MENIGKVHAFLKFANGYRSYANISCDMLIMYQFTFCCCSEMLEAHQLYEEQRFIQLMVAEIKSKIRQPDWLGLR